jgi:ATP synthase protein I
MGNRRLADDSQSHDLDSRIARARAAEDVRAGREAPPPKGYSQGARVLAEMIGAPLGGGIIGWALDKWFGTFPWIFVILLVLSFVVAGRNIYRISQERAE